VAGLILLLITAYFSVRHMDRDLVSDPVKALDGLVQRLDRLKKDALRRLKAETGLGVEDNTEFKRRLALGHGLFRKERFDEALREYNRAIQIQPDRPEPYYWRGQLLIRKGEQDRAIRDFERAIELNASYAAAYDSLGWLYSQKGRDEEGIGYLNRSLELNPKNGWAYYNRGRCHYRKGNLQAALADSKKACELGYKAGCEIYEKLKGR